MNLGMRVMCGNAGPARQVPDEGWTLLPGQWMMASKVADRLRWAVETCILIQGCSVRSILVLLGGQAAGPTLAVAQTSHPAPAASALFASAPHTPPRALSSSSETASSG
jgi:hypothetical protein